MENLKKIKTFNSAYISNGRMNSSWCQKLSKSETNRIKNLRKKIHIQEKRNP